MSDEQKPVEENIPELDDNSTPVSDDVVGVVIQEEELATEDNSIEMLASEMDDEPLVDDFKADESADDDEPVADGAATVVPNSAEEGEAPRPEGTEWYVIHSYSGYENKVQKNLYHRIESMDMHNKIFQVVVPTEEEVELRDGQRRTIERRVFPGYILVEMVLDEDSWYVVRNTPGVTGFVGSGNKPTPLRQDEVDKIIKRMDAEVPKIKVSFKVGQKVRIVEGPFEDFMGTVDDIDLERARVRVLVNFFGRETPIELDFLQVERT
jgi:transcription termination/antitermination protein NusG